MGQTLRQVLGAKLRSLTLSAHGLLERPVERSVNGVRVKLWVSNERELSRLNSYESKEPATLAWIDSFRGRDVFYDVGANIGQYTIYAALRHPGIRVYGFEPESQNFAALNRNISLNDIAERATAFPIALSDAPRLDTFNVHGRVRAGEALHQFGGVVDDEGHAFVPVHRQGAVGFSLDALVHEWGLPCPTALKIDVDGLEGAILRGAGRTLGESALRTILIEVNEGGDARGADIYRLFAEKGWRIEGKHPARRGEPSFSAYNVVLSRGTG